MKNNDLIKILLKELIKMYNDFMTYKKYLMFLTLKYYIYVGNISDIKKELLKEYYSFLEKKYNIKINLSDLTFIINNYDINNKLFKNDLSLNQIDLLNLFDFKYLSSYDIRIKIKTIEDKKSMKKRKVNYIIINFKGGDKLYNIIVFKHKIDFLVLNNYLNKTEKIRKDKKRVFFKKNKYNYAKCKNKVFRKKEKDLLSVKKYSHNFKKSNSHYKKYNDMDLTYDMLNTLINDYYTNKDLLNIYVNDYNINNHLINVPIIMERLLTNMELIFNEYKKTNKEKYYLSFKFMLNNYNQIKSFNNDLKDYKDYLIKNNDLYNKKTSINDYY